jgi:biopolymer transport protein ExbD
LFVEIAPDSSAPYSAVLPVLNLCHRAALTNVTILEAVMEDAPPLPVAGAGATPESLLPEVEPIRIHIAADGSLKLGGEAVTLEQLRDKLKAIARQGGTERQVVVSGDAAVRAARIQEVMEVCGKADLTRMSFEKATGHLREIDLAIALKSYEALQTRLRDARLERELLVASGSGEGDEALVKAERLIATLEQQVTEERAMIEKLQSETAPDK